MAEEQRRKSTLQELADKAKGLVEPSKGPLVQQPGLGATHLVGMGRKGLTELAQYLPAFNQAGAHQAEDMAIWPNQTQGEIAQARGGPGGGPEQEKTTLAQLEAYAKAAADRAFKSMERGNEKGGRGM